jgi:hypothetical protein
LEISSPYHQRYNDLLPPASANFYLLKKKMPFTPGMKSILNADPKDVPQLTGTTHYLGKRKGQNKPAGGELIETLAEAVGKNQGKEKESFKEKESG